jgi:pyrroloquinoline quinone biosynthesis protein B
VPQWNCACRLCEAARSRPATVEPRTQDCLALGADGAWVIVNCSPDIRAQLLAVPELAPPAGSRDTPVREVLLTDAELDHAAGILQLREAATLRIFATAPVLTALCDHLQIDRILPPYLDVSLSAVAPGRRFSVCDGAVLVDVVPLSSKRPRYAAWAEAAPDWVVGYRFWAPGGPSLLYAPCFGGWSDPLEAAAEGAGCVVVDGTFWSEDELGRTAAGGASGAECRDRGKARQMGHLPISGPQGSLRRVARLSAGRRVYTHLNNTNPVLDPTSREAAEVAGAGVEVAVDGMELEP